MVAAVSSANEDQSEIASENDPKDEATDIELATLPTLVSDLSGFVRYFGRAWSIQSLRACLSLALVYCWVAYFSSWGLGASGRLGDVRLLADPDQPARLIGAISVIMFPLLAIWLGRTLGRLERRGKLKLVRWWRRNPKQRRKRLRLFDFERRYQWVLALVAGTTLTAILFWFRRGDVAAFTILFSWLALGPVAGIAMARRFSNPAAQGFAAFLAGFGSISGAILLILAFAGAGVAAFAFAILGVTNVVFAGALGVLLDIVIGGVSTVGLALAGASVATIALALAGAGTGIATLTGVATLSRAGFAAFIILMSGATIATLAFEEAAVLSAAISGISALTVASTVSQNRMGHHGAYAGAIGAIALMTIAAVLLGWGDKPLVIFAVSFFLLLPVTVGLHSWLAFAMMRHLLERIIRGRRGWLSAFLVVVACWLIGMIAAAALAYTLGYGTEGYNQVTLARSGLLAFDIEPMINRAIASPFGEGLSLTLLLLAPLLPALVFTAILLTDGLLSLQPHDYRLRRPLFRGLGIVLTFGTFVSVMGVISATDMLDIANHLGGLAKYGLHSAHKTFSTDPTL